MKKTISILSIASLLVLCGCTFATSSNSGANQVTSGTSQGESNAGEETTSEGGLSYIPVTSADDEEILEKVDETITFSGSSIAYSGSNSTASISGSEITLKAGGTYSISGTLNDGRIIVEASKEENVRLVLNNVTMTSSKNSPIYVKQAKNAKIYLLEGTLNTFNDASSYTYDNVADEEPNACIFSKDDLVIEGSGKLLVNGNFNNAIQGKDDVAIEGGEIEVNAVNNGIKGKDSVTFLNTLVKVTSSGDGIQASDTDDTTVGYITVDNSSIDVTSKEDGMQAEGYITINSGQITVKTGNGSSSSSTTTSQKGIKCTNDIWILGASISINSQDDCIHSNHDIVINGGDIIGSSGDDGIHADSVLTINGGKTTINKSYEGLEAYTIYINGGTNYIKASDDGLNAAGGSDTTAKSAKYAPGGGWGPSGGTSTTDGYFEINGGNNVIDASGDGIDSNGIFKINGGNTFVGGPTSGGNGALDYGDKSSDYCAYTGGTLVATAGTSDMAVGFSSSESTAYSILANITSTVSANQTIALLDSSDNVVLCFKAMKSTKSIVMALDALTRGTYRLYTGGSYTGGSTLADYIYVDGTYNLGTLVSTITVSSFSTTSGSSSGGGWH